MHDIIDRGPAVTTQKTPPAVNNTSTAQSSNFYQAFELFLDKMERK
jgi:hypothetical protein